MHGVHVKLIDYLREMWSLMITVPTIISGYLVISVSGRIPINIICNITNVLICGVKAYIMLCGVMEYSMFCCVMGQSFCGLIFTYVNNTTLFTQFGGYMHASVLLLSR